MKTKLFTRTGLFAALICMCTAFILHIPFGLNGGYVHIGDTLIYLAACLLPRPYAMVAAAIGGGLADLLTAPIWTIATIIIKMSITLPFTSKKPRIINLQNILACIVAGLISILGYYIAELIIFGQQAAFIASITSSLFQAIGSGILFILVGISLDKHKRRLQ